MFKPLLLKVVNNHYYLNLESSAFFLITFRIPYAKDNSEMAADYR